MLCTCYRYSSGDEPYVQAAPLLFPTEFEARLLPDVIIMGVRKAGTGALELFLNLHPDILATRKEAHFFDKTHNYLLGIRYYTTLLRRRKWSGQLLLEKTPAYFFKPEVEKRIHAAMPDVKLLLVVREPVSRMISEYCHFHVSKLGRGIEPTPFEVYKYCMTLCSALNVFTACTEKLNHFFTSET